MYIIIGVIVKFLPAAFAAVLNMSSSGHVAK